MNKITILLLYSHLGTSEGQLALVVLEQPLKVDKNALGSLRPQEPLQAAYNNHTENNKLNII